MDLVGKLKGGANKSSLKKKLSQATNDEPWGPPTELMQEIAGQTYNSKREMCNEVMSFFKSKLKKKSQPWQKINKIFKLMEFLIVYGSSRIVYSTRDELELIRSFSNYRQIEKGDDKGRGVRSFVEHIVDLLTNSEMLEEEREKAKEIKNRMGGANRETGFGSNVGDGVQGAGEKYSGFGPNSKRKPADSPFGGAYKDPSAYDTMGAYDNYESKGGLFDKIGVKKEEKEKETKKEEPSQKEKKEKEPSNAAPPKKKVLPPPPNFSGASNVPKGPSLDEKAKSASVKEQPKGSVDLLDLDFVGTSSQNSTIGTTAPVSIRQGSNMGNSTNGVASSSGKQEQNKHDEDEDLFDDFQEAKDDDDFFKDFEGSESTAATSTQPNQSGLHQQAQISFAVKQPELITMSPKKESKPVEPVVKPRKKGDLIDDLIDLSDIGAPSQKDSKKPSKDTHASEQSLEASLDSYSPNQDYGLRSTNYHPVPTTFQPMMPSHGYQNYQNMPYGPQMGMNMMGNQPHYPGMAPIYGQGGMMQPAGMHGMLSQYGGSAMGMGMMSHGGFQGASQPMGMRPNGWGPMQN